MRGERRSRGDEKPARFEGREVGEVALRNFVHASAQTNLLEIAQLMSAARIRHVVVLDGARLGGVLSYRDVQDFALRRNAASTTQDALRSARASDLMRRDPITAEPSMKLREAARRMLAHRVGCLPVVEGAPPRTRVVGVLTESDLLRAAFRLGP